MKPRWLILSGMSIIVVVRVFKLHDLDAYTIGELLRLTIVSLVVCSAISGVIAFVVGAVRGNLRERWFRVFAWSILIIGLADAILVPCSRLVFRPMAVKAVEGLLHSGRSRERVPVAHPSDRLAGCWRNVDQGNLRFYSPVDPSLKIGTCRFCNNSSYGFGPAFRFRVVDEDSSTNSLVVRIFQDFSAINAAYGLTRMALP